MAFTAPLRPDGARIEVSSATETHLTRGDTTATGDTLSQSLDPCLPDGRYEVRWNVKSDDGAALSGTYHFVVGTAVDTKPLNNPLLASGVATIRVFSFVFIGALVGGVLYALATYLPSST